MDLRCEEEREPTEEEESLSGKAKMRKERMEKR